MPWCGIVGNPFWWILPLIGLVFVAVMFFVCFRGFGCFGRMGGRRCKPEHSGVGPVSGNGRPT